MDGLNWDYSLTKIKHLTQLYTQDGQELWVRPDNGMKSFIGGIFEKHEIGEFFTTPQFFMGSHDETVIAASPKEIFSEFRFFVFNRMILTSSSYRIDNKRDISQKPTKKMNGFVLNFVNQHFDELPIGYVIDVADTPYGLKYIELNQFNSSGLYSCDPVAIISAIKGHYG